MTASSGRLDQLETAIEKAAANRDPSGVAEGWRKVLDYFFEISRDRVDPEPGKDEPEYQRLWDLARRAMSNLGGQAAPALETLADYNAELYGPMLGVSDSGLATAAIRKGALAAPKGESLVHPTPLTLGIAHDAERLGAVGEVVVGPDEFATIRLAAHGRVLTTTNVGTKVNVRTFMKQPVTIVGNGGAEQAINRLKELFKPFVKTASGKPRALTVLISFAPNMTMQQRRHMLAQLSKAVAAGDFCKPKWHCLGVLVNSGRGKDRVARAEKGIDLAAAANLTEVALVGLDDDRFDPDELDGLLKYAGTKKVHLRSPNRVDPQTTARHVWAGLAVARNMGLELGKYGLSPLSFEDQKEVIARIQYWFPHWCAAPVYYLDYPLITAKGVYHEPSLGNGIRLWLEMVAKLGVRVVLIDTAKKAEGRHLLKESAEDKRGFLTAPDIGELTAFAAELGVKTLWAGGISLPQAYACGKLRVFGIYVTSAAAGLMPLTRKARIDPFLTGLRVPQKEAITRVKLLLEAGFLVGCGRADLESAAKALIAAIAAKNEAEAARLQTALHPRVVEAWRDHFANNVPAGGHP
ncbi:MAG TPA: hypothetical protein VH643_12555 [Gemmataceae bacterium]|jgi:hypothetical protein